MGSACLEFVHKQDAMDPCGLFWWKDLMQLSDIYRGVTRAYVGLGGLILFWKDEWKDGLLQDTFSRAFSFARDPDMSVQSLLSSVRLGYVFHLPLSMEARLEVTNLQLATSDVSLTVRDDTWKCVWGGSDFKAT